MRVLLSVGCLLLGLSACGPKQLPTSSNEAVLTFHEPNAISSQSTCYNASNYPELSEEDRARLIDVPMMVDCPVYKTGSSEDARMIVLLCKSTISLDDIVAFYRSQMICWGWNEIGVFIADDSCLVYKKPTKLAVIQVSKSDKTGYEIKLFIGPSRSDEIV